MVQANPLWPVTQRFSKLEKDIFVDVAIAGGGMAGISAAYHLQQAGYKVAVLEADEVGGAASGASSGVLYYGSGTNFVPAIGLFGAEKARLLWHETATSIEGIVRTAQSRGIECGLRRTGAVMAAKSEAEVKDLVAERAALARAGIKARLLSADEMKGVFTLRPFLAGLEFGIVSQIRPAQFAAGLAKAEGLSVYENTPMKGWEEKSDGVVLQTPKAKVTCSQLVIATNYKPLFGLEKRFAVESSVILASQPMPRLADIWPEEKIIWTMEEQYDLIYPEDGRAILELYRMAGEDAKLRLYYPGVDFRVEQRWGDSWSKTADWLPIIGKVSPRIAVAVAMGDQGIVMGWTAGRKIAAALEGKPDAFLEMASPKRFG
jgi:glycine/D-amino acid oxidase-like deaminating enzyme